MLRIVVLILLTSGAMVACRGGAAESNPAAPTAVSDDAFRWSAQQAVNAVLLTEDDFPANFALSADDGSDADEDEPAFALTGECAEFNEYLNIEGDWLHSVAEAETGDFEDEDGDGFSASAAAFRTVGDAELETNLMVRFFGSCIDQFEATFMAYLDEGLQQVAVDQGSVISDLEVDISEIAVPVHGDWTFGIRFDMTFVVDGIPVRAVSDSVSVRVGRMVGTVEATIRGELEEALENQRDSLVALVAARLAAENEKLP